MTDHSNQKNKISRLIHRLYEAAVDEQCWSSLAPQIAHAFDSTSAAVMIQEAGKPGILTMTQNISNSIEAYRQYFWNRDVWVERGRKLGISQVGASQDLLSDAEFEETEFYRDWCRYTDVFYVVGSVFRIGRNELGVLGIHRPRTAGTYQNEDKVLVSQFLPHIQRALQIRNQLGQSALMQCVSLETLRRTETATIVVRVDGNIAFANPLAESLLERGDALCSRSGRLAAVNPSDSTHLLSLIQSASESQEVGASPGGAMVLRRAKALPLTVLVAPFRLTLAGLPTTSAIVFIRDPNRSASDTATLQALFQLTFAEARIAQGLANGRSLTEIAASHRVSPQTVRKQLKSIFEKTGTNRQAQCVAAILRSVAAMSQ